VIRRDGLVIVDFDNMYLYSSGFQADREFRTAGISFDSDLYVRNLAFREPGYWVFWRMPAVSGTNALSLDDIQEYTSSKQPNGYWERGWTFTTTTVSEVSFNIRVQSDFEITCYNSEDQPVQTRTVLGVLNPNRTPRDLVWWESGADYPSHHVEMKGQGMKRCAFRARGGIIDDLTFRPEQERKLELSCNAYSIERGQPLNCAVSAKPNGELREIRWKFVDSAGHEIPGPQDAKTWGGPIVVGGRVHVSARIGEDSVMRKDTLIAVRPRAWPRLTLNVREEAGAHLPAPSNVARAGDLADGHVEQPSTLPSARIDFGPNTGWWYVPQPLPAVPVVIHLNYAAFQSGSAWFMLQSGGTYTDPSTGVSYPGGYCTGAQVPTLFRLAREHEGTLSSSLTSHVDAMRRYINSRNPQAQMEAVVAWDTETASMPFYQQVASYFRQFVQGPLVGASQHKPGGIVDLAPFPCYPRPWY
jgi:hypothetical protein